MKLQDLLHITTFWDGRYFIELKRVDRTLQCCCWGWEVRIWYSNTQTFSFSRMNDAWTFQWTPPRNLNLSRSTATTPSATCSARCIYFLNFKFHLRKKFTSRGLCSRVHISKYVFFVVFILWVSAIHQCIERVVHLLHCHGTSQRRGPIIGAHAAHSSFFT